MAKQRLNINYYFSAFEGKTLEEAEAIAIQSVKGCERPIQAKIAFNALEAKYEGYKSKDLSDTINYENKVRDEYEKGASKTYLMARYNLKSKALEAMLKDNRVKDSFEDSIPVEKKVDKVADSLAEMIEQKKAKKKPNNPEIKKTVPKKSK